MCLCCGVKADFEAFAVECCEEAVDHISAPVPSLGVEESAVDEPLGDPFVPREQLLALGASQISKLFLVRVATYSMRSFGHVE
jgi:hypothetical protein